MVYDKSVDFMSLDIGTLLGFALVGITLLALLFASVRYLVRDEPFKPEFSVPDDVLLSKRQRVAYEVAGWVGAVALSLLYLAILKVYIYVLMWDK